MLRGRSDPASRIAGHTAIEAVGLGLRFGRGWALRNCTFRLPAGRVCALVGPNGAGKSTLFALAAGLHRPTEGTVSVFGVDPATPHGRAHVAILTQGKPLYPRLTVAETLRMGYELNRDRWSHETAERIVRAGDVPLDVRVGTLSSGQRTRVALALVFGRRPELMLLDEPLADLDPLVRHEIVGLLMAQAAEHGTTIVLSSHVLAELDGVCDYVLVLADGRVRVAGEADDVIGAHTLLTGPYPGAGTTGDAGASGATGATGATGAIGGAGGGLPPEIAAHTVIESRVTGRQLTALVRRQGPVAGPWTAADPTLEELLLSYLRVPDAPELIAPSAEPRSAGPRSAGPRSAEPRSAESRRAERSSLT
ncbi:ABC transporter ATP-binding protein [Streptomyces sp. NPDC007100]|uniref:ABC transporter ATP-binding protein n=1 Tax=Streptomyces sp. NPDC007100 TaxID=3155602 RepID=UPI0033D8A88B